jgi:putative ABC transport system permease protein
MRDYNALKERLEHVDGISFEATASNRTIKYRSGSVEGVNVTAVSPDFNKTWTLDFQEGRYFTESEGRSASPVIILGAEVANGLFDGESAIGKQIKVLGRRMTVVGVFKKEGDDMLGMSQDNNAVIPLVYAKGLFDIENEQYQPQITVRGKESVGLEEVESELYGTMRSIRKIRPGAEDDFSLNKTTMLSNQLDIMFKMVNIAGWVIGGFSILVGGFGIANIMFVSVKERTNIIGIQKSLGAKNYFILLQFMFEAIALCLMGGLLGLLLVFLVTQAFTHLADFEIILDINNVIMGISISVIIGAISGFWPAFSASRLDPVEAIRS